MVNVIKLGCNMNLEDQEKRGTPPKKLSYDIPQDNHSDEPKAQKFILTDSLSEDIRWLADAEGTTKTDIVKEALKHYFHQSHYWNNKRLFLEKTSGLNIDISQANTATQVNVMWCNDKEDPLEKSAFVACRLLDFNEDEQTVIINPMYYLPISMANDTALIKKSEVVVPRFIDFDPNNKFGAPYLNNLKYEIKTKYIWSMF